MTKEFDLSQFETRDTAALTIKAPNGNELVFNNKPVVINVYGPGSKEYMNAKYKLENSTSNRTIAIMRGKTPKNAAEEARQDQAEFLAAITESIVNFPIEGGALALYLNPKLGYITEQVDKFLGDTENFMPS